MDELLAAILEKDEAQIDELATKLFITEGPYGYINYKGYTYQFG